MSKFLSLSLSLFFLVALEFELRASCLQRRHSTASAIPLIHLALVILEMGSENYLPGLDSNYDPPISACQLARIIGLSYWCLAMSKFLLETLEPRR
jgi:hypothetical protein